MRRRPALVIFTVLVILGTATALAAADDYQLSSPDATEVPARTVTYQGEKHTFDSVIDAEAGDTITVNVDAPPEVYRLHIRDNKEEVKASKRRNGSATVTYDLTGYDPGSYGISPFSRDDGTYKALLPLIVSGYEVSVDAPDTVEAHEEFEVTIDVKKIHDDVPDEPAKVQAVVADDNNEITTQATKSGSEYVATVNVSELGTGDYTLWGIAQGEEKAFGRNEVLGRSPGQTLTIQKSTPTPTPTPTPTSTPAESSSGGGGGGGGGAIATPSADDENEDEETGEEAGEGEGEEESESVGTEIDAEPDVVEEQSISAENEGEDQASDPSGVRVAFEKTEWVRQVTFASAEVSGSVTVREYNDPPASIAETITQQLTGGSGSNSPTDGASDVDADSSSTGGQSDAETSGESSSDGTDGSDESNTGSAGDEDTSSAANGDTGTNVVTIVDISPTSEAARTTAATVTIEVSRTELDDPTTAVIVHESAPGNWERLETSVEDRTADEVTLQAEVNSFSLFAVVTGDLAKTTPTSTPTITRTSPTSAGTPTPSMTPIPAATQTPVPTATPDSAATPTATTAPGAFGPGFSLLTALAAGFSAILAGLWQRRRRNK